MEDEDIDYDNDVDDDDHDDVASLMKEVSASGSDTKQTGEESDNDSLLDNISANYDKEDDVGPDPHAKLASISNKAFKYSGGAQSISVETIKKKQKTFTVVVPKVNPKIWNRMKQGPFRKRD